MRKKTLLNLLLILGIAAFFIPGLGLGYYCKLAANRVFASSPDFIESAERVKIGDYNWRLKDEEWDVFRFDRSEGKWVFINFWASWRLPSEAELKSVSEFHQKYKDKIDFYIITNEERPPVLEFMEEEEYDFPVTYLIIGDPMPVDPKTPSSYLINPKGEIVIHQEGIARWNSSSFYKQLDALLTAEPSE
jgi:thiol-disulfide isomerase/thioredoxin